MRLGADERQFRIRFGDVHSTDKNMDKIGLVSNESSTCLSEKSVFTRDIITMEDKKTLSSQVWKRYFIIRSKKMLKFC